MKFLSPSLQHLCSCKRSRRKNYDNNEEKTLALVQGFSSSMLPLLICDQGQCGRPEGHPETQITNVSSSVRCKDLRTILSSEDLRCKDLRTKNNHFSIWTEGLAIQWHVLRAAGARGLRLPFAMTRLCPRHMGGLPETALQVCYQPTLWLPASHWATSALDFLIQTYQHPKTAARK